MKKSTLKLEDIQLLHQQGQLQEAKEAYLEYLDHHPDDVDALHAYGLLCAQEDDLATAIVQLTKASHIDPNNLGVRIHLSNLYKSQRQYEQAINLLHDVIARDPACAPAYNNLGVIFFAQQAYGDAVKAYQEAIDLRPDFADAYYNLGLALLRLRRDDDALSAFHALMQISPKHPGAHFQVACVLMKRERFDEAIQEFTDIIDEHPNHFESYANLANCFLRLGRISEATEWYTRAINLSPHDKESLYNLGVIHMRQGMANDAIDFYQRALNVDPDYFDAHNNLGGAYLLKLDYPNALLHFKQALRLQPHNAALKHTIRVLEQDKTLTTSAPAYVQSLFDSYAEYYDAHLSQALQYQVPDNLLTLLEGVGIASGDKLNILDLGCGTGLCGERFKKYAQQLIGVDLSKKMLDVAARKNLYDQLAHEEVLDYLAEREPSFDLVLAGDVLVYFGDLEKLLRATCAVLKPGGYFAFNVESDTKEDFKLTLSGRFAHKKTYLQQLARQVGFKELKIDEIELRRQRDASVAGYLCLWQK